MHGLGEIARHRRRERNERCIGFGRAARRVSRERELARRRRVEIRRLRMVDDARRGEFDASPARSPSRARSRSFTRWHSSRSTRLRSSRRSKSASTRSRSRERLRSPRNRFRLSAGLPQHGWSDLTIRRDRGRRRAGDRRLCRGAPDSRSRLRLRRHGGNGRTHLRVPRKRSRGRRGVRGRRRARERLRDALPPSRDRTTRSRSSRPMPFRVSNAPTAAVRESCRSKSATRFYAERGRADRPANGSRTSVRTCRCEG